MRGPYPILEAEADFAVEGAGKACKTWYTIFGSLAQTTLRPLIVLHGGPGVAHNYLLPLQGLALPENGSRAVILYDQLGCGRSTHLPELAGRTDFWTVDLFLRELENLLKHLGISDNYDVIGQSWGGMLGAEHAIRQPKGLKNLIISNSPASMITWVEAAAKLRKDLPADVEKTLLKHEADGTTDSEEYEQAMQVYYDRHVCRVQPNPKELVDSFTQLKADGTVYMTMNGPSEFYITGSLRTWSVENRVDKIIVPTLLINGKYDEAQDEVMQPFFDLIKEVRWIKFGQSSHTPQLEETTAYLGAVKEFLG